MNWLAPGSGGPKIGLWGWVFKWYGFPFYHPPMGKGVPASFRGERMPRYARSVVPGTAALPVPWDYFSGGRGEGSRGLKGERMENVERRA